MLPVAGLEPATVQRLTAFLESPERPEGTLGYVALRGYLFALANGPRVLPPSAWLGRVFGPNGIDSMVWDDEEAMQDVFTALLAVWNDVVARPEDEEQRPVEAWFGQEDPDGSVRRAWCAGFVVGWELVESDWFDAIEHADTRTTEWFTVCQYCLRYFSDPEAFDAKSDVPPDELEEWVGDMNRMFPTAIPSYAALGRHLQQRQATEQHPQRPIRVEKGPGRNDPCPCGSGKKYKKCCLV